MNESWWRGGTSGVDVKSKGKEKEACTLQMSPRIALANGKLGIVIYG